MYLSEFLNGKIKQERIDCEAAGVPLVDIPQGVIFQLTNLKHVEATEYQDVIIRPASNQGKIEQLKKQLLDIPVKIDEQHLYIRENLKILNKLQADYHRFIIGESLAANINLPTIVIPESTARFLSSDTVSAISDVNNSFKRPTFQPEKTPAEYKTEIEATRSAVQTSLAKIDQLNAELSSIQTTLTLELFTTMKELQANPIHVLTGEEIFANYKANNI